MDEEIDNLPDYQPLADESHPIVGNALPSKKDILRERLKTRLDSNLTNTPSKKDILREKFRNPPKQDNLENVPSKKDILRAKFRETSPLTKKEVLVGQTNPQPSNLQTQQQDQVSAPPSGKRKISIDLDPSQMEPTERNPERDPERRIRFF